MADLVWDMRTRQRQLFQNVVLKDLATSLSKKVVPCLATDLKTKCGTVFITDWTNCAELHAHTLQL